MPKMFEIARDARWSCEPVFGESVGTSPDGCCIETTSRGLVIGTEPTRGMAIAWTVTTYAARLGCSQ